MWYHVWHIKMILLILTTRLKSYGDDNVTIDAIITMFHI